MEIKSTTEQQQPGKLARAGNAHRIVIGTYALIGLACLAAWVLVHYDVVQLPAEAARLASKLLLAGASVAALLIVSRLTEQIIAKRVHTKTGSYNIIRAIRLISIIIAILIVISFLNSNWYTAAVSLGLISLILGFALQTPIASLIGWFYIVIRTPFRVGDRIQVGTFTGDVVEISYLDTTLWEFAGNYMTNDLPSGRLIRFPNSLIFTSEVYNYSWNKFPYIWNEIPFHVAYESDLDYLEQTIKRVAKAQLPPQMDDRVRELRSMIEDTPVDEVEIKEYPFVHFRTNANTWIEVLLIYLVEPKHAGSMRTQLIREVLKELNKEPDKAMFPKTNNR